MTSTPDLNISGSPIYEHLVATSGDPYQPPAYQLPEVQSGYGAGPGAGYAGAGMPAMLSQFLSRILGDGQSWVALVVVGGPMADQLRQQYQPFQQYQAYQQHQTPQPFTASSPYGYAAESGIGWHGANALSALPPLPALPAPSAPPALPALPAAPEAFEATAGYGGMATQDWASWLGQTSQSARPLPVDAQDEDEQEVRPDPYERRGGRLSSRFGAAMRELRGR